MSERPQNHDEDIAHKADLAVLGASRADQGALGANDPLLDGERQLLLKELEAIGRVQRSMKPAALEACTTLLGCPQVLARVSHEPTSGQLLDAAHAALKAAIAAAQTKDDQLVAQAILAATDEFAGKIVDERKRLLDETYGISLDTFRRRRPVVLKTLVAYLTDPGAAESTPRLTEYRQALRDITCLAEDAARLSSEWRGYLFICKFNQELTHADCWPHTFSAKASWMVTDALYKPTLDLMLTAAYCFDNAPYSQRARIAKSLPAEVLTVFPEAVEEIWACGPLGHHDRADVCKKHLEPTTALSHYRKQRVIWHGLWDMGAKALRFGLDPEPEPYIATIISACRKITWTAYDWFGIKMPHGHLEWQTGRMVASYYGVDASATICQDTHSNENISLQHYVRYFLMTERILPGALPVGIVDRPFNIWDNILDDLRHEPNE